MSSRPVRLARIAAQAIVIGLSIAVLIFAVTDWSLSDATAYWNAANRLRDGSPLYPIVSNVEASDIYRYAPWFAWLAVPMTFLPAPVAGGVWSAVLVGASVAAIWPMLRMREWLGAMFFGSILIGISAIGNAQPLIIAALMLGVERRSGPAWIALAASLKAVPIVFALVYLGRRQWIRFGLTCLFTVLLVAPAFLYNLSGYVTDAGDAALLYGIPLLYGGVVLLGASATVFLARSRWGWLAAGLTAALALPRFFVYDATFLVPGLARKIEENGDRGTASHPAEPDAPPATVVPA